MKVFQKQQKSTQVEQVLSLLVESGFAYISIWVRLSIVSMFLCQIYLRPQGASQTDSVDLITNLSNLKQPRAGASKPSQ